MFISSLPPISALRQNLGVANLFQPTSQLCLPRSSQYPKTPRFLHIYAAFEAPDLIPVYLSLVLFLKTTKERIYLFFYCESLKQYPQLFFLLAKHYLLEVTLALSSSSFTTNARTKNLNSNPFKENQLLCTLALFNPCGFRLEPLVKHPAKAIRSPQDQRNKDR